MPPADGVNELVSQTDYLLAGYFEDRILPFDSAAARLIYAGRILPFDSAAAYTPSSPRDDAS